MAEFRSFVSESELEERRKKRQEEWEKVRNPEDPEAAPDEEYDPRTLFERLQEQKDKKQADFEEAHKLRNMVRGLDDDEVEFLDLVDRTKEELEAKRMKEENRELNDFRKAVAELAEQSAEQRLQELKKAVTSPMASGPNIKKSQTALLATLVKRKSTEKGETSDQSQKKQKGAGDADITPEEGKQELDDNFEKPPARTGKDMNSAPKEANKTVISNTVTPVVSELRCIGVLPGLGAYSDSSDSENSSNSEADQSEFSINYDLLGRPRVRSYEYK